MFSPFILLLVISLALGSNHTEPLYLPLLDSSNFDARVNLEPFTNKFVYFYASSSFPESLTAASEFTQLSVKVKDLNHVTIARIDCDSPNSVSLCFEEGIFQFPTLKYWLCSEPAVEWKPSVTVHKGETHVGAYSAVFFEHFVNKTLTAPTCTLAYDKMFCTAAEKTALRHFEKLAGSELETEFDATLHKLDELRLKYFEQQLDDDHMRGSGITFVAIHELRLRLRLMYVVFEANETGNTEDAGDGEDINEATL